MGSKGWPRLPRRRDRIRKKPLKARSHSYDLKKQDSANSQNDLREELKIPDGKHTLTTALWDPQGHWEQRHFFDYTWGKCCCLYNNDLLCTFLTTHLPINCISDGSRLLSGYLQQSLWTVGGHGGVSQKDYPEETFPGGQGCPVKHDSPVFFMPFRNQLWLS